MRTYESAHAHEAVPNEAHARGAQRGTHVSRAHTSTRERHTRQQAQTCEKRQPSPLRHWPRRQKLKQRPLPAASRFAVEKDAIKSPDATPTCRVPIMFGLTAITRAGAGGAALEAGSPAPAAVAGAGAGAAADVAGPALGTADEEDEEEAS